MKRTTLEALMALVRMNMSDQYDEIAAQLNATISIGELARRGWLNSGAAGKRDADGKATIKWELVPPEDREDYGFIARGVLNGLITAGAIVLKDSPDEPYGVTVTD